MSEYAKYIFLMNKPGVWFLLPPTPLLLFKWSPSRGEQTSREQFTAMPRKWAGENRENKVIEPTPSSLFRLWFWEDFKKCCQRSLKTERSSWNWKVFSIDYQTEPLDYGVRPSSTNPAWFPYLPLTSSSVMIHLQASNIDKESQFSAHGIFLHYKYNWVVPLPQQA